MLQRTHLMISLFFILLLFPSVVHKITFFIVAVVATYLPDIDSRYSKFGRKRLARILQFFTQHRGVIHSFTFLILITLFFALFFPVVALGFFLGYGSHLLADSFTTEGIYPFYPWKKKAKGLIKTGGSSEIFVLFCFIFLDLILIVLRFDLFSL